MHGLTQSRKGFLFNFKFFAAWRLCVSNNKMDRIP